MNVSWDLETLGNTSQAPIIQIGAIVFDDHGNEYESINIRADISTIPEGFVVDYSTLKWWFEQSDVAIKSVMGGDIDHGYMMVRFGEWVEQMKRLYGEGLIFWSHATFDPPILDNNFKVSGLKNPIPFRNHRDLRTLSHFAGEINIKRKGVHHNAFDDADYQMEYIIEGLRLIREPKWI